MDQQIVGYEEDKRTKWGFSDSCNGIRSLISM